MERVRRQGRHWWLPLLGSIVVALPLSGQAAVPLLAPAQAPPQAPLVMRGVTVIDVRDGTHHPDRTVVITGNRIQALGAANVVAVPRGAHVVEAHGKYLIPGLWDMHVHMHGYIDVDVPLLLANGVTGIRDAGSRTPLAVMQQWKREIATGARIGPRLVVSGPRTFEANDSATTIRAERDELTIPRALLPRAIDSLRAAGADMLKTYFYSREGYFRAVAAARRAGLLVGGHLAQNRNSGQRGLVGGLEASDSGATFLDHGVNPCVVFDDPYPAWDTLPERAMVGRHLDAQSCAAAVARFRQNNSWSVVTLAPYGPDSLTGQPFAALRARVQARNQHYRPDSLRMGGRQSRANAAPVARVAVQVPVREPRATADWAMRNRDPNLEQLVADSVPMLISTDTHPLFPYMTPGFALHEAMVMLALHGASPLTVLQTATLNPATALRATDSLGTVEVGKVADLVLLDADPLADIWNTTRIRVVVANGRYYDRQALDALLVAAEQAARKAPPFDR